MRRGAVGRLRTSWISSSALLRAVRSPARFSLCRAIDWWAFCFTVPINRFLSPRRGTRMVTGPSRSSESSSVTTSASDGRSLHELGDVGVVGAVGYPAALAADEAAAHGEDLHGHLERVDRESEDVGVRAFAQHHRLLL